LYDTSRDGVDNVLVDYLKTKSVTITCIDDRPTFGDCFELVHKQYPGKKIILANADIYFNETLGALNGYDFNNVFMALTRWDVQSDGTLKIFEQYKTDGSFDDIGSYLSQDVWIFQTPLRGFANPSFRMGTWACDGYIAYQAYMAGLQVINPCLTVQCCHLHQSGVRHWTPQSIPGAKALILPWVSL
ncbi:MAG: hypothetical protein P4L31_07830, partial [Candidatus Babeliales bacterium]|nr:hypothetical protein [Candidatus Babeliales bacterium]